MLGEILVTNEDNKCTFVLKEELWIDPSNCTLKYEELEKMLTWIMDRWRAGEQDIDSNWRINLRACYRPIDVKGFGKSGDARLFENLSPMNGIKLVMLAKQDQILYQHCLYTMAMQAIEDWDACIGTWLSAHLTLSDKIGRTERWRREMIRRETRMDMGRDVFDSAYELRARLCKYDTPEHPCQASRTEDYCAYFHVHWHPWAEKVQHPKGTIWDPILDRFLYTEGEEIEEEGDSWEDEGSDYDEEGDDSL